MSWKLFGIAFIATLVIDFIWLGLIAKGYYLQSYGDLARTENGEFKPILWAAFLVYICLAAGIVFFALPSAGADATLLTAFIHGACLGLIIYGVYDMTAMSVIRGWPLMNSFVDIIWGGVLCGVVTMITKWAQDYV